VLFFKDCDGELVGLCRILAPVVRQRFILLSRQLFPFQQGILLRFLVIVSGECEICSRQMVNLEACGKLTAWAARLQVEESNLIVCQIVVCVRSMVLARCRSAWDCVSWLC